MIFYTIIINEDRIDKCSQALLFPLKLLTKDTLLGSTFYKKHTLRFGFSVMIIDVFRYIAFVFWAITYQDRQRLIRQHSH